MFSVTVIPLFFMCGFIGYPNGFTEEASKGLISLLKRRLHYLRLKQQTVACTYRGILQPTPQLVEDEGEMEEMDWQRDLSSEDEDDDDDEDDAEVGTQVTVVIPFDLTCTLT